MVYIFFRAHLNKNKVMHDHSQPFKYTEISLERLLVYNAEINTVNACNSDCAHQYIQIYLVKQTYILESVYNIYQKLQHGKIYPRP